MAGPVELIFERRRGAGRGVGTSVHVHGECGWLDAVMIAVVAVSALIAVAHQQKCMHDASCCCRSCFVLHSASRVNPALCQQRRE